VYEYDKINVIFLMVWSVGLELNEGEFNLLSTQIQLNNQNYTLNKGKNMHSSIMFLHLV